MHRIHPARRAFLVVSLSCVLASASTAWSAVQSSAITYQGLLQQSGSPMGGNVDLQFRLYDAAAAGAQIGAMVPVGAVAVVEGVFTTSIDFGTLAFDGNERWLEIDVRSPAGSENPFVTLSPRQKLASTPYAAFALQTALGGTYGNSVNLTNPANTFAGAFSGSGAGLADLNAVALTGTINSANVGGTYSNAVTFNNAGNSFVGAHSGDGSAMTALNASNISSGTLNIARFPTGGAWNVSSSATIQRALTSNISPTLQIQQNGANSASSLRFTNSLGNHFNTGLTSGGDFSLAYNANIGLAGDLLRITAAGNTGLGTVTPVNRLDVEGGAAIGAAFSGSSVAPANGLIVEGDVGIGTATPDARLHATGANVAVHGVSSGATGRGVHGEATSATGINYGVYGESASTTGRGVLGLATSPTGTTVGGKFENQSTSGVGVVGGAYAATGTTYGVWGESVSTSGRGVQGLVLSPSGVTYGFYGESASTSGRGIYAHTTATTGTTYGGRFETESASGRGVMGSALAATGFNFGVRGENASTSGVGVFGLAYAASGDTYGVLGRTDSPTGHAISGTAIAVTGINYGGFFESGSIDGRGVFGIANATTGSTYGGRFQTASTSGRGVLGLATTTTGANYGVQGQTSSSSGIGVFGVANAASGATFGVYGRSESTDGTGVYGESADHIGVHGNAPATSGVNFGVFGETDSSTGRGVYGRANSSTGTVYGVYGENDNGAGGYAVFADGDLGTNTFKTFRIDHPSDPANKYLIHYSAESNEVINFYSGKVTLNGAGEAIVDLPAYFALVNTDPRYTLTAVGAAMPNLHVALEVDEASLALGETTQPGQPAPPCFFKIAGGAPGMKVSWEVKAVRNDRYARAHPALAEREKEGMERGTYQSPELYGLPEQAQLGSSKPRPAAQAVADEFLGEGLPPSRASQDGPSTAEPDAPARPVALDSAKPR